MNGTHLHLLLNHFPIIGTFIVCGLMAWAIYKKNAQLKTITAVLIIVLSVISFIADQTGETAEDALKGTPGVTSGAMHTHEDAAGTANLVHMVAGLFCIGFLFVDRRKLPAAKNVFIACFALSVVAFGLTARAGYYGGLIRHPEIEGNIQPKADTTAGPQRN